MSLVANPVIDGREYRDQLTTTVDVQLGFLDRLRVLWHGQISITSRTLTENVPGKTLNQPSSVYVPKIVKTKAESWAAPESWSPHDRIAAAVEKRSET